MSQSTSSSTPKPQVCVKQSEGGSYTIYVSGGRLVVASDLERSDIEFSRQGLKVTIKAKAVNVVETEPSTAAASVQKSRTPDTICIALPKGWNIGYGG